MCMRVRPSGRNKNVCINLLRQYYNCCLVSVLFSRTNAKRKIEGGAEASP